MQKNISFSQLRRQARVTALQILYQWGINKHSIDEIKKQFDQNIYYLSDNESENISRDNLDQDYLKELLSGVMTHVIIINNYISRYITRPLLELDMIELMILRLSTFELLHKREIPPKVIINEALELAKLFGSIEGHKFINGVLDKIAREIRVLEFKTK